MKKTSAANVVAGEAPSADAPASQRRTVGAGLVGAAPGAAADLPDARRGAALAGEDAPATKRPVKDAAARKARRAARAAKGGDRGGEGAAVSRQASREPVQVPLMPTARPARRKRRHVGVFLSFLLVVVLPLCVAGWYLYTRAADQYASHMGFSVRKEEGANASEVIGGIVDFSTATASDSDILYEFIQSQGLVEQIDARLDLRSLYSLPENDPVFTIAPDAPIEDLLRYWKRMVTIYYDGATGLIETRVLAFTPEDAQAISRAIFDESSAMINRLSKVAREDATRYAREELALAQERLREARTALTEFRARTQLVDPNIDIQGQMGVLNNLQAQLAESLIELDMLRDNTREGDPRIRQAEQRINVIENRIAEERKKFGISGANPGDRAYASLVGEYESLAVNREFAEQTYLAALANFDAANAEAQRKTRYLAAYAQPTLAQSSEYPQRLMILGVLGVFATALWAVGALVYYSIRDRR